MYKGCVGVQGVCRCARGVQVCKGCVGVQGVCRFTGCVCRCARGV